MWFDPRFLSDYDERFARVRRERKPPLLPLRYGMSTYYSSQKSFARRLREHPPGSEAVPHFASMIFEVQSDSTAH